MSRKPRRHFTDDFKQQIVDLYTAGKSAARLSWKTILPLQLLTLGQAS